MNKKETITFFIIMIIFCLAANYVHPVTPTYFKMLKLDNSMFGIAFSTMALGMFLLSPFWGKINDYVNSKTTMFIGAIGYATAQLIFALATNSTMIIIARLIAGFSNGAVFISFLTYIINMSKEEDRSRNLTINATIQSVCGAFGYFIGGMVGEVDVYLSMYFQIIQLAIAAFLFLLLCKKDNLHPVRMKLSIIKESNPFNAFLSCREYMTRTLACLFIVSTLTFLGATAFEQCFNYYLKDVYLLSSGYNGIIKASIGIISLIANMTICIYLMRKTNIKVSSMIIIMICSITMFLSVLVTDIKVYMFINIIYFAVYAISIPLIQDVVSRSSKENSNSVMGFYQATKSLGMIIGAYVAGIIYNSNPKFPFIFGAIAFLVAFVFAYIYYYRDKNLK